VAAHLFAAGPGRWVKRKEAIGGIAWLCFQLVERNAAPINAGGGAGFEPIGLEAQLLSRRRLSLQAACSPARPADID
jgi:hypothetical protein